MSLLNKNNTQRQSQSFKNLSVGPTSMVRSRSGPTSTGSEKFTLVSLCLTKNAREVSSPGKGDIGFNINTNLMLAHSASRFMQQISKTTDSVAIPAS